MDAPWRLLVFGASGAIGGAVAAAAKARGWSVTGVTRSGGQRTDAGIEWLRYDPLDESGQAALDRQQPFDAVCWAQGANMADSLLAFDVEAHLRLYRANVLTTLASASALLSRDLLRRDGARLVVISSIWQERARQDKLSYAVTKAAIGGLVRAAAVDLGEAGHLVNAVLPGVLDTPMTRANLSAEQLAGMTAKTRFGRLPDLETVAEQVLMLCSRVNRSISGQSIPIDLGMSNANLV